VRTSKGVAGTRILFNSASDHGFMGRYQAPKPYTFRLLLAFVYRQSTLRMLPVPLFGQSRKGYSRKAEVRSVLMSDNLIRKLPALESTDEFVRKNVGKALDKESF
jgi:hypothetical protein